MKTNRQKKRLTFGDLVATIYDACETRRARRLVRWAVNTRVVVFRGRQHFVVV